MYTLASLSLEIMENCNYLDYATLENILLKGEEIDTWINIFEKLGQFSAVTRANFNKMDVSKVFQTESIK